MSDPLNDLLSDDDLKAAWGSPAVPDFDTWTERHADAVAFLNPVVTHYQQRRRRFLMRTFKLTALTACLGLVIWLVGFREGAPAYAQAFTSLKEAETVTWTTTYFLRMTSHDGQRTWIQKWPAKNSYRHPGLYREERFDENGKLVSTEIRNTVTGETLSLHAKEKQATHSRVTWTDKEPQGPFALIEKSLQAGAIEFVGRRKHAGGDVNVFRKVTPETGDSSGYTEEFLIDAQTKQLVEYRNWNVPVDLASDPDLDKPAEKSWSKMAVLGGIQNEIVLGAKLAPELFSLEPPAGYTLETKERPTITEAEMLEFLKVSTEFSEGVFGEPIQGLGFDRERYNALFQRDEKEWTPTEKAMVEMYNRSMMAYQNRTVIPFFIDEHVEKDSFRYIGKGIKLGTSDRIICWYKLKKTGQYRAVYGDLTVKDVKPEDLPLDVK